MNNFRVVADKTTIGQWQNLLETILKPELETARTNQVFHLDFEQVDKKDNELGELIIEHPLKAIGNLYHALREQGLRNTHVDITNFAPINQKNLIDLRTKHLNQLISIEGIVLQISSVKPRLSIATFQCQKCGAVIKLHQDTYENIIREPAECYEDQGGCGRVSTFKLLPHLSDYEDYQEIIITNPYYEQYRRELILQCYNEHCNQVLPGDTITFNGIYSIDQHKEKLTQETFLLTQGYESSLSRNLEFTEEEQEQADQIASDKNYWSKLINNFAPTIYGNQELKEAALLQQFGGNWYDQTDGTSKRGSIHVLYVGDPGTVKSTIMQASARIAPIYTKSSGRGATVAGITAGATKDPLGEGWMLQAGALVKANGGICYLDEFDKLPKEVQGSLHTPMEQGVVEQSKMGNVNQSLAARTAILASMNPKDGRFEYFKDDDLVGQINVEPALLSRFDIIFAVRDNPNTEQDRNIANHIHESITTPSSGVITTDFLRKYIHHGKQYHPMIPKDVNEHITEWFIENRSKPGYHINWRHYEGIRRLAEASAKARFSNDVLISDAVRAITIFEKGLVSLQVKDIDSIITGSTEKERCILESLNGVLPKPVNTVFEMGYEEAVIESLKSKEKLVERDGSLFFGGQ